jgi:superoxide dismutase, Fe-Mn family
MERTLAPLPYAKDALEPYVTGLTLEIHYERHHRGYLEKLLDLVEDKPEQDETLEKLIRTASGDLYDNAAQVWNHAFYWNSLKPGGSQPEGDLLTSIERDFGSFDELKRRLGHVATTHFGSGWAWLVLDGRKLRVVSTRDAGNPLREGGTPLLTLDLWEHAYYLDYFNERKHYVENVIEHLLDWDFAAENLRRATAELDSGLPREIERGESAARATL